MPHQVLIFVHLGFLASTHLATITAFLTGHKMPVHLPLIPPFGQAILVLPCWFPASFS